MKCELVCEYRRLMVTRNVQTLWFITEPQSTLMTCEVEHHFTWLQCVVMLPCLECLYRSAQSVSMSLCCLLWML